MTQQSLKIAMLSIHASPIGELGTHDTGGMSVYIRELSKELGKKGHRVDIYTRSYEKSKTQKLHLAHNVNLISLDIGGNGNVSKETLYDHLPHFYQSMEAYRISNSITYDLVHSHYWLSGCLGNRAQHDWNVPHILMFHTIGMAKQVNCSLENEPALRLIAEKRLAHESTRIVAPTLREKTLIERYCSVPGDKIGIIPCGVNTNRFQPVNRELSRELLGLHHAGSILLYVGRFAPVKGIDRLVAAMAHLRSSVTDVQLVIIGGDGKEAQSFRDLKRLIHLYGLDNTVTVKGRIDHSYLRLYYSASDVLIIPSYYESFGLVALESLACGTPVVSTPVGAMESLIRDGKTGSIVKTPSPQSLAHSIESVISRKDFFHLSRQAARASVLNYSWAEISSSMIREYDNMLLRSEDQSRTLRDSSERGRAGSRPTSHSLPVCAKK